MTPSSTTERRTIVVGVDGSKSSIDALRGAARVAAAIGAEIDAVTCWEYPASYGYAGGEIEWRPDLDAEKVQADALLDAFGNSTPPGLRGVVREGHPTKILIDESTDAEMLVVGSRGHGGFLGLLLGSVSSSCAEHASCPVLVMRATARDGQPAS